MRQINFHKDESYRTNNSNSAQPKKSKPFDYHKREKHVSLESPHYSQSTKMPSGFQMTVSFLRGDGIVEKKIGLFKKAQFINFGIRITVETGGHQLKKLTAYLTSEGSRVSLGKVKVGSNKFDVPKTAIKGNRLEITVQATYKLDWHTSKVLTQTISANY